MIFLKNAVMTVVSFVVVSMLYSVAAVVVVLTLCAFFMAAG